MGILPDPFRSRFMAARQEVFPSSLFWTDLEELRRIRDLKRQQLALNVLHRLPSAWVPHRLRDGSKDSQLSGSSFRRRPTVAWAMK